MTFRLARLASMAVVAILATHAVPARANLITNGGFEASPVPDTTGYLAFTPTSASPLAGWTVVGNDVAVLGTSYTEAKQGPGSGTLFFNAQEGNYLLDLTGVTNSGNSGTTTGIYQDVTTVVDENYHLSFYVGRLLGDPDPRYSRPSTVNVSIGNGSWTLTNSNTSPPGTLDQVDYQRFEIVFTATSASTRITFMNGSNPPPGGNNFVGLDNIQLIAAPEPATIVSGGIAGLLGLGLGWRRRRKARAA